MGKYNGESSTHRKINTPTDDVIERCERIIREVEKKPRAPISLSPGTMNEFNRFSDMQKENNPFSSEETFNDYTVLQAIDRDIEASKKTLPTKQKSLSESPLKDSYSEEQKNKVLVELDDSFNEEIARLEPKNDKKNQITILQNITVIEQKAKELINESDDEIFSDIDIVENTPPKKRQPSDLQRMYFTPLSFNNLFIYMHTFQLPVPTGS